MRVLIKNGLVLRPDGTAEQLDVRVDQGMIAALGTFGPEADTIDARDRLIAPGLINTHCHSNENYFKGCFDNLPLELWMLFSYPVLAAPRQSAREIYVRTMLGCIEMLKTGCTAVVDFLYEMPEMTDETVAAAMQAYVDSGMRVLLVVGYADKVYYETVPLTKELLTPELKARIDAEPLPSAEESLALVDAIRSRWDGLENRLSVGLGPSGPQRCSDRELELSAEYAERHDLRIHIHTLETKMQAHTGHLLYGRTIVEHLAELGFLSPRVSLNHAIWLTERDIDLLAQHGAMTTHNLLSNFKLGSGISPVPQMLARGIDVSLGTDGKSSNDSQDMYEVLKTAALLHKTQQPEFERWLGAAETWRMGTISGARSIGMADQLGQIVEGQRADLVLFNLDTVPFIPLNNPLHQLVYCLPSSSVDTVLVEGQIVVRDGRLTRVDEPALLQEGAELGRSFVQRSATAFDLGRQLMPTVASAYRDAVAQDVGVNRHISWPNHTPPLPRAGVLDKVGVRVIEVIVEIPQGSRNKYEYDHVSGQIRLDRVLHSSVHYPTDYGFIPGTLSEDGDPLDVLLLVLEPTFPGCRVPARPVGLLRMRDEKGDDEKILAVPTGDPRFDEMHDLGDLPTHFLREIENFFATYKLLEEKDTELLGWENVNVAQATIVDAQARHDEIG